MKKLYSFYSILPLFLLCFNSQSQSYHLTVTSAPYHDLVGGIPLVDTTWDDPSFTVPLGFNFDFFGETTTSLYSPDVFVGGIFTTNLDINALNVILAFSADLIDRGYDLGVNLSPISYKTEGTAGARVTTVEYNNAGFYSDLTQSGFRVDYINFQLKIYEGTGDIEILIGPYSIERPDLDFDGSPGPVMGLVQGLDYETLEINGEMEFLDGNPLSPDIINSFIEAYLTWPIPENTVYRFSRTPSAVHDVNKRDSVPFYYPNPSTEFVTLNPGITDKITSDVSVINAEGIVVKTDSKTEKIELDGLPAGIYVLRFQTDAGQVTQRISLLK